MAALPTSAAEIIALPRPNESWLVRARARGSFDAATHFPSMWKDLSRTVPDDAAVEEYKCPSCDKAHRLEGRNLWARQFMIAGAYYDYSVRRLLECRPGDKHFPPGLNLHEYSAYLAEFDRSPSGDCSAAHIIISHYISGLIGVFFTDMFRRLPVGNLPTPVFECTAHRALLDLHRLTTTSPHRELRSCASWVLRGLLELTADAYGRDEDGWNRDHRPGPFSSIRLPELARMACRDKGMIERYGAGRLDKVYEQQLALIMQSLGFLVVQTRRGERTVDLVCIAADPREPMSILVEAKSSSHPYTLPVDDQRALVEYAEDVRRNLTTLPAMRLVLIIGPSASPTLESRLADLERELRVPIRFTAAQEVANLREMLAGPLPMNAFLSTMLGSTTRVVHSFVDPIREYQRAMQGAHANLVRTLLTGAESPPSAADGWEPGKTDC